ncbi:MAG: tetratricopeptide repeat protein, partial [Flavobacteriales bacterium]
LNGLPEEAILHLKKAVLAEDKLVYTEPAAWHIPTRQNLGAILLKNGQLEEAEKIYKEDLAILRQNGWSLIGLYHSLIGQGKIDEAKAVKEEFETAWQHSDIKITTSIL